MKINVVAASIEQIYEILGVDIDGPGDPRIVVTLKFLRETSYDAAQAAA